MDKIRNLGYKLYYEHEKEITYTEKLKDIEVLVCYNPFSKLDISKLRNLKWIQLSSIGIDQAPLKHIRNNEIILTNNKGGYSIPMGEWVVMKSLELLKNSKNSYNNQLNKNWKMDTSILEIYNKTIGFIGTGSIAIESAKRFQGFGVNILGLNTTGKDVNYFNKCYPLEKIKYMVSLCDIIVLSIPYTVKTHYLINEEVLSSMKENSYIINVSRGNIVNEKALINSLKKGNIKGAALDVFEKEPLPLDSPLWEIDNVIITPHNSWMSEMRNTRRFNTIYENMKRYKNGEELINVVNLKKGY